MRVALVHEFLTQFGGAERVLAALCEIYPDAPVYTLIADPKLIERRFQKSKIRTSFLQKIPASAQNYKYLLPLMPKAVESFDFSKYDLVVSDASAFAKGIISKPPTKHVCYCHTPTRYIWENKSEYIENLPYPKFAKRLADWYVNKILKPWDLKAAKRPDEIIANSQTVQERIVKYYGRTANVIYPPVDTDFFHPTKNKQDYFFSASRLEPYKKIDLVIEAFQQLKLPLKIAGTGTMLGNLRAKARGSRNIEFLGEVSDQNLRDLYSSALAYVFPALEDAGMMTVEALACGTPVVGLNKAGTAEFIIDGQNGVLFECQTANDIAQAVHRIQDIEFKPELLRSHAQNFSKKVFEEKFQKVINEVMEA